MTPPGKPKVVDHTLVVVNRLGLFVVLEALIAHFREGRAVGVAGRDGEEISRVPRADRP